MDTTYLDLLMLIPIKWKKIVEMEIKIFFYLDLLPTNNFIAVTYRGSMNHDCNFI